MSLNGPQRVPRRSLDGGEDLAPAALAASLGPRLGAAATFAITEHFNLQTQDHCFQIPTPVCGDATGVQAGVLADSRAHTLPQFSAQNRRTRAAPTTDSDHTGEGDEMEAPHERERIGRIADLSERDRGERGVIFLVVRFRSPDYARMKRAFDDLQPLRERHGARGHRILRLADDPQGYMVIIEFTSFGGAQGFTEEPLLLRAIDAARIEGGAHHVQYVEEFREQLEAVDYTW